MVRELNVQGLGSFIFKLALFVLDGNSVSKEKVFLLIFVFIFFEVVHVLLKVDIFVVSIIGK